MNFKICKQFANKTNNDLLIDIRKSSRKVKELYNYEFKHFDL